MVADSSGAGLPGITVSWWSNDTTYPARVSPSTVVTDADGLAKASWTLGTTTGVRTATTRLAFASADVSGVGSVLFRATTRSLVPLTDMGGNTYFGFSGGLYPSGNSMPMPHSDFGRTAADAVEPLDTNGDPDPAGKYVLLSVGASNTSLISCGGNPCYPSSFTTTALADPAVDNTNLAFVNGASWGGPVTVWESPSSASYNNIRDQLLGPEGLSELQVQAVWLYVGDPVAPPNPHVPGQNASGLVIALGNVMRTLRIRYPNLKLVFVSSRVYGGHVFITDRIKEPYSYEHGFAMKWLVQAQIDQMANGGTIVDGRAGDLNYNTVAPWIAWGPYLWADGLAGRSDGLTWLNQDFSSVDGAHLSTFGIGKAAEMLVAFLKTSPQGRCWFVIGGVC